MTEPSLSAVATPVVLSGMRPTGQLHLGNYHGALKNWVALQKSYDCYFLVADWHALTTGYEDTSLLQTHLHAMVIDWLAAGLDPERAAIFVQSQVPAHAELHLLLSMITPLPWLERVPTYKDQQLQLKDKDLATYGFLGYPLLQSADILIYRPAHVPVGEDQVAHVEITREVARRFNHLYGADPQFTAKAKQALRRLSPELRERYQSLGPGKNNGNSTNNTNPNSKKDDSKQRTVYIYAVTTSAQAEGEGPLYKAIHQPLIAKVKTDAKGLFQCKLPPGTYSVFTGEENGQFFASLSNGKGELNPVVVVAGKVTVCDIVVNHKAVY